MKYQESFVGTRQEFVDFVKKVIPDLFAGRLTIEGKQVSVPSDMEIDYKIKYDEDDDGGSFTLKASWEEQQVELDVGEE